MRSAIYLGMVPFLCGWIGCRQATPVVPGTETYSVEAKQSELVVGEARKVDILVRYHRTNQPAANLKYTVQLRAPRALTVTPSRWDVQQNLTTGDAGLNYSGLAIIEVAEDASPGEVEVAATITPAKGTPTTAPLRFRVVGKGG